MALVSGQEFYSFEEVSENVKKWKKKKFCDLVYSVHQELSKY